MLKSRQDGAHAKLLHRGMLLPGSGFRLMWDVMSVVLVLYVSTMLPYKVAFLMDYVDANLNIVDFVIDCFFLVDVCDAHAPSHVPMRTVHQRSSCCRLSRRCCWLADADAGTADAGGGDAGDSLVRAARGAAVAAELLLLLSYCCCY